MGRITHENWRKTGYWTAEDENTVVQKLGMIEYETEALADDICAGYCKYADEEEERDETCAGCPVTMLLSMII